MEAQKEPSYWAAGWSAFAGIMLIMLGLFHAIAGLSEVIDPDAYVVSEDYVFKLSSDAWGWIHLLGGIIVFFAGFAIFRGAVWGRTVGVIIALVSAFAAFSWLPYRAGVGDRDHRDRHRRDLGADGARSRRHRLNQRSNGSEAGGPLRRASCVPAHAEHGASMVTDASLTRQDAPRRLLETASAHRARAFELTVAWQGGEPTMMGLDIFRRSVELAEKHRMLYQPVALPRRYMSWAAASVVSGVRSVAPQKLQVDPAAAT